ncbi:hypothetical protein [Desulfobacula sp.]
MKNSTDKTAFLGRITASVSHDLQNVLAIIKETSGLMEDFLLMQQSGRMKDFDTKVDKCLKTIKKQTYRGVDLTSGLNGFAHTADSSQTSIGIFETLNRLISIAQRLFSQKGVPVSLMECHTPCSIVTDPMLFQMTVFLCIESLIDTVDVKAPITLTILASEHPIAIKILCGDDALNSDDYSPKITHAPQWPEINTLCEQINMTAQIIKDAPGILISVK